MPMRTHSVAVVIGGSSLVGRRVGRLLGREHHVVLSDTHDERLHRSLDELDSDGVSAESIVADPTDRASVEVLMRAARSAGPVGPIVHLGSLGVSETPAALRAHVASVTNVTRGALAIAEAGTSLLHTATPTRQPVLPVVSERLVRLAYRDPAAYVTWATRWSRLIHGESTSESAMATFTHWHAAVMSARFAVRGAALVTVTPGGDEVRLPTHSLNSTVLGLVGLLTNPRAFEEHGGRSSLRELLARGRTTTAA